jgi:uncharacterized protein
VNHALTNRHRRWLASSLLALTPVSVLCAESCLDSLDEYRVEKEAYFLNSDESPFDEAFRESFAGFSYFDSDKTFCLDATFEHIDDSRTVDYPTFDNRTIPFRRYGIFHFEFEGEPLSLVAFQRMDLPEAERQWVLVMFRDRTNGNGSYSGGRYLQIDLPIAADTVIDFNRADNPYCAYLPQFACPVPPVENWLDISIPAGEMDYTGSH